MISKNCFFNINPLWYGSEIQQSSWGMNCKMEIYVWHFSLSSTNILPSCMPRFSLKIYKLIQLSDTKTYAFREMHCWKTFVVIRRFSWWVVCSQQTTTTKPLVSLALEVCVRIFLDGCPTVLCSKDSFIEILQSFILGELPNTNLHLLWDYTEKETNYIRCGRTRRAIYKRKFPDRNIITKRSTFGVPNYVKKNLAQDINH